jgi:hypothetical protein
MLKTITGSVLDTMGQPVADAVLTFQLTDIGINQGVIYSPEPISTTTDLTGGFTIDLWVNQLGLTPVKYRVLINRGPYIYVSIPNTLEELTITDIYVE